MKNGRVAAAPRAVPGAWAALVWLFAVLAPAALAADLRLTYLGAAGWEMKSGDVVVLVDPYLSRIRYGGPRVDDGRRHFGGEDIPVSDTALIDRTIERADYILVQHAHPDHILDVPYIAKKTGAKVIATETANNILRAYGVPDEQLYTVQGGEDYEFGDFSVRVVPSLHSALGQKGYFSSERYHEVPKAPLRIIDHIEGGALMFLVRLGGKDVLTMGSMNFFENEVAALKPDVLLAGAGSSRTEIYRYTERLLKAAGLPDVVIPTHWDNFFVPYEDEASQDLARNEKVEPFVQEASAASPKSRIIVPRHLVPIVLQD